MSDSHFLDSIQQSPSDLTRRLVYADWLEENGDSRAEYLRIECEMATESLLEDRYWDLKERRNELRPNIDPDWRDQLGYGDVYRPMFTKLPEERMDRWRLMDRFIDYWHQPLTRESGNTAEEIEVVGDLIKIKSIQELYRIAGRRMELFFDSEIWPPNENPWLPTLTPRLADSDAEKFREVQAQLEQVTVGNARNEIDRNFTSVLFGWMLRTAIGRTPYLIGPSLRTRMTRLGEQLGIACECPTAGGQLELQAELPFAGFYESEDLLIGRLYGPDGNNLIGLRTRELAERVSELLNGATIRDNPLAR